MMKRNATSAVVCGVDVSESVTSSGAVIPAVMDDRLTVVCEGSSPSTNYPLLICGALLTMNRSCGAELTPGL